MRPEDYLGYRFVRLAAALEKRFRQDLAPEGLSPREFSILAVLVARPAITTAELARAVLVTPQSMAALVDGLERRGLVARAAPRRRGVAAPLSPTPAGAASVAAAAPRVAAGEDAVFGVLTDEQRALLRGVLGRLEDVTDA